MEIFEVTREFATESLQPVGVKIEYTTEIVGPYFTEPVHIIPKALLAAVPHRGPPLATSNFISNHRKTLSLSSHITKAAAGASVIEIEPSDTATSLPLKKVLIPIGLGTEEMEAVIMVIGLRQAGADVVLASVEPELEVRLSGGTILVADTSLSECSDHIYNLVALPVSMLNMYLPSQTRHEDYGQLNGAPKYEGVHSLYNSLFSQYINLTTCHAIHKVFIFQLFR